MFIIISLTAHVNVRKVLLASLTHKETKVARGRPSPGCCQVWGRLRQIPPMLVPALHCDSQEQECLRRDW
jgi:hypothetical protein